MPKAGLILLAACAVLMAAGAPAGAEVRGDSAAIQRFGAALTLEKGVSIEKLAKNPARFAGRTVLLVGTVKEVCQGRGCWVEVESPKGASFIARSLDESVLLPRDCKGRRIAVQGVVKPLPRGVAEAAKPEGHACPVTAYVVATAGVELR